ncbi:DUF6257 family protein [Streptomyces sp. NPDC045431]|uniref:DUF6257 family protein n=1 Tax=Streptomyces sp. NPDC045431 TaxID=3155613 RepID=UPI0034062864
MGKHESDPKLSTTEKAKVAYYVARMCKRGLAGETVHQTDLERKVERVIDSARQREERAAKK